MRVTVFGATGGIGSLIVAELLERGHEVSVHARDTTKVPALWADRTRVVIGELSDGSVVDAAVTGADAVISALGPSLDRKAVERPLVAATASILDAMRRHGVTRYISLATPSVADPHEKATLQRRAVAFMGRTFLPRAYEELLGMNRLSMSPDLRWTVVRFTAPTDGPPRGNLRIGFFGSDKIGFAITRADIAAFTAAQVDDDRYIHRAPAISN